MQFHCTNKTRKDERQRERWMLSPQAEQLLLRWAWNEIQMLYKFIYNRKFEYRIKCVGTCMCMCTKISSPELFPVFAALTRKVSWKQLSANFVFPPGLTSSWVKCHWFGGLCISFTAGLCPALKPIYKDLSNCLATLQGGRLKCCRLEFHPLGMNAYSHFTVLMKCYLTWNWGSPVTLQTMGEKRQKMIFMPSSVK